MRFTQDRSKLRRIISGGVLAGALGVSGLMQGCGFGTGVAIGAIAASDNDHNVANEMRSQRLDSKQNESERKYFAGQKALTSYPIDRMSFGTNDLCGGGTLTVYEGGLFFRGSRGSYIALPKGGIESVEYGGNFMRWGFGKVLIVNKKASQKWGKPAESYEFDFADSQNEESAAKALNDWAHSR